MHMLLCEIQLYHLKTNIGCVFKHFLFLENLKKVVNIVTHYKHVFVS